MSVKKMTVDQIQGDLADLARRWPDGPPPEQYDRVNALKAELKRRGVTLMSDVTVKERPAPQQDAARASIAMMSSAELDAELARLTEALAQGDDAEAQNRHADVRFEIRKRAREASPPAPQTVQPRAIEIPDSAPTQEARPERMVPRREMTSPVGVKGFAVTTSGSSVMVTYVGKTETGGLVQVGTMLSVEEAAQHLANVQQAIDKARSA